MDEKTLEWLNAGGADVLFETVRRYGWKVELAEEWEFLPEIVSVADRDRHEIAVNSKADRYYQVCAVLAAWDGILSYGKHGHGRYPMFKLGDDAKMYIWRLDGIVKLCRFARYVSAAVLASVQKGAGAG